MESMIEYFRFIFILVHGFTYIRQEAPKGELGLYIVTDNRNKIYHSILRIGFGMGSLVLVSVRYHSNKTNSRNDMQRQIIPNMHIHVA